MTDSCHDPYFGESHTNQKRTRHDTNIAQRRITTTGERIIRNICKHNDHPSVNTNKFIHHYLTERNIFNKICTNKFKERVTLTKSNSDIV